MAAEAADSALQIYVAAKKCNYPPDSATNMLLGSDSSHPGILNTMHLIIYVIIIVQLLLWVKIKWGSLRRESIETKTDSPKSLANIKKEFANPLVNSQKN